MLMPFALFAASFCGRRHFKAGVGPIMSFWVLVPILGATGLIALFISDSLDGRLRTYFLVWNWIGLVGSALTCGNLCDRLIKDRNSESSRRWLGETTRFLRWVPFCCCAADDREVEARYEPYACSLIALVSLLSGNVYGLLLLIGAIALVMYERGETQSEIVASERRLSHLRRQIAATDGHLRTLLATSDRIVKDLHFVTVLEAHQDLGSPIAQQLGEIIRQYEDACPNLIVDESSPRIESFEALREACYAQQSMRIEKRLRDLRDQAART